MKVPVQTRQMPLHPMRRRIVSLLPAMLALCLGAWLTTSASQDGVVTVCPAGPPLCDYATIQAGIDASSVGDTVLVSAGTYPEQVTLKSHVMVTSESGPTSTAIIASRAPVVSAEDVVSATLRGFSITGQDPITTVVGIELIDSSLAISDTIIRELHGMDAGSGQPDGQDAIGIRSRGHSELILSGSSLQDISGGERPAEPSGRAGSAAGIRMDGTGRLVVTTTALRHLAGGDTGGGLTGVSCDGGVAGWAVGIHVEGRIDLEVDRAEITDLVGGAPCSMFGVFCRSLAGSVRGIEATGGTVSVRNTTLARLSATMTHGSQPSYAIYTSGSRRTTLESNTITSLSDLTWERSTGQRREVAFSPYCPAPAGTFVAAVAAFGDTTLSVVNTSIHDLAGSGAYGRTVGIFAQDADSVTVAQSSIGGVGDAEVDSLGNPVGGIVVARSGAAHIRANTIELIEGSKSYTGRGGDLYGPGDAVGIELHGVTEAVVVNNALRWLTGGRAVDQGSLQPGFGGDATAVLVSGSLVRIQNNTCYWTIPGLSDDPRGGPGVATGLRVVRGVDAAALNNLFVHQGIGFFAAPGVAPIAGHNAYWDNETDYAGVSPGSGDMHVEPAFVDPEHGDLHLTPDSPLIDAGSNVDVPAEDWEGEPRPVDGDGDGLALADIGADEFWPGLRYASKNADRLSAHPGDTLSYSLRLVNPASRQDLPGVVLTDTLSNLTDYVAASLSASVGAWGYADGVITWTGTLPAGGSALITYRAVIAEPLVGPQVVANEALVADPFGPPQAIRAYTLVNPLEHFFPWVGKR